MQIASEDRVFIFDLIKLYEDKPELLGSCFRRILCSSNVLKLGIYLSEKNIIIISLFFYKDKRMT